MVARRFDVFLVTLDPTVGHEIRKTRPCAVISPDEMNDELQTVIVAPMTTRTYAFPMRVASRFQGRPGFVILDQIRTVDRRRLVRKLGKLPRSAATRVLHILLKMFSP